MLPKDHMTSGRRVRIATVVKLSRMNFLIEFERTEADTVLRYVEISEDLLLEPISIVASLLEEGGG